MLSFMLLVKYLTLACCVTALQHNVTRNTIFADERLQGEIFESVDIFSKLRTDNRNNLDYRLPKTTRPIHYNLQWTINMLDMTFSGTVEIQLTATQANVNEIVIHSHELSLSSVSLMSGTTTLLTTTTEEPDLHFLRVKLTSGSLEYNAENVILYSLVISFDAPIRDDMNGIYRSWFRNNWNDPTVSWMVSTQFAATSARFAFPCYDEPSFKATFDIVITRPSNYKSWSNTRLIDKRDSINAGYEEDIFSRTPIMSTYLLAFVVAEYESLPTNNINGNLMYEVIGRPGAISTDQGTYALQIGQQITEAMSEHTGIDFFGVSSNLKMTHAAIPDFSFGAMENWGLIVYREAYIMYDPNHTSDHYRQLIAYLLGHEIAHMWYGNLVTLEFWDNMWLNEGFAQYYQYFLTHMVKEHLRLDSRFITEQVHTALLSDSSNNPHALTNPSVGSPDSVYAMFSTISYNKGAAIIRMTEHLLGSDVHRLGLQNYLKDRYLDVAIPNHLFQALQAVAYSSGALDAYGSDFSIFEYYRSWTEQGGHPVLFVDVNHKTGDMTIQQRRFNINTGYSNDSNYKWIIPITFASASNSDFTNTKPSHIISQAVTIINRGSVGDEWVIFNKQQTGFYRVNYDEYTWDQILLALRGSNRTSIHEFNRAQIVDDVFQFARSGIMSYSRALNILSFLENETEYTPWVAAMTGFNWLRNRLAGTRYLTPLETLIARWATPIMNQLTYEPIQNESFMRSYLRWQLAPVMCAMNVRACRDAANTQFRALVDTNTEVNINSRNWVYCNGLREGSEADFDFLWQRYQQHNVYTEKIQILQFIGCTPHASRINIFLRNIVEENFIMREQDYNLAFNSVLTGNEENTLVVLAFIQNNMPAVIKAFGSAATPLSNVAARLRSIADVNSFLIWVEQNKDQIGDAYSVVVANAELTRQSMMWVSEIQDDLNNYFVNGDDDISTSTAAPITSPSTIMPSDLIEPETPDIPDSACTTFSPRYYILITIASRWFTLLLGLALTQGLLTLSPIPVPENEWEEFARMLRDPAYRLPTTTIPRLYEVRLTPYFDIVPTPNISPFSFDGEVSIYISPTQANIRNIVMHCKDMTINSVSVELNGSPIALTTSSYACEEPYSFLRIDTAADLQLNQEYVVKIDFTGRIQNNMRGFYRSWYVDSQGQRRWMGTTQFQPGHAREAFPCYDEPGFKAYFDITIIREEGFSPTISNMPIRITEPIAGGRVAETFHRTALTSTYLLAFIVSHYVVVAEGTTPNRPFQIYARDNAGNTGDWSLEIGELLLAEMENYTQFPYYTMAENMNMKQAAIPDFSAGAMENWGLLTYREAFILYDPENSNHFYKQRVANIVSHEIAHMWFGNLVTCAWWDNLWLNEGFARFYQYYLTNTVAPELGYDTRFIVEQVHTAMLSDSVDSAHALTNPNVNDPTSVTNHFSTITYARGASVLRMTQYLLGVDTYVKGLRKYLQYRKFNVAEPHHLFEALDEAADEDNALASYPGITIETYLKSWSEKAGHPILSVSIDQRTGRMTVSQARWERDTGVSSHPSIWDIPITWTRANAPDFENLKPSLILSSSAGIIERGSTGNEWVIFNKQQSGFYKINYDDTNWALLTRALRGPERTVIHEHNRAQIVDDLFVFARAGVKPYNKVFNILSFLEFEDAYAPWIAAITGFNFALRRLADDTTNLQKLQNEIIRLSVAVTNRLGYSEIDGEPFMDGLLRMYVLTFLCDVGHPQCEAAAKENFANWRNGGNIPANMRPWVYCSGLRQGDAEDFNFFWDRYLREQLASEIVVMLQAGGCTSDEASLNTFLNAILTNDDIVRPQDYTTALNSAITGNEYNTMRFFEWLKANVNQIAAVLGSVQIPVRYVAARLINEEQIAEFSAWIEANRVSIGEVAYNEGIVGIASARRNVNWSASRISEFSSYFDVGYVEDVIDEIVDGEEDNDNEQVIDPPTTTPEADSANVAALSPIRVVTVLLLIAGLATAEPEDFPSEFEFIGYSTNLDTPQYRLLDNVRPTYMYVDLDVYLSESRFNGNVQIEVEVLETVSQIVLHQNVLSITSVSVLDANNNPLQLQVPNGYETDSYYEIMKLNFASQVTAGNYTIIISYLGQINENPLDRGFYKGYYYYGNQLREYATTQFQPYHARKAFPCFDEPQFKNPYIISITRDASLSESYSNMAIGSRETIGTNRIKETFLPTPIISAYLIAFHVSDFVATNTTSTVAKPFQIIAREGVNDQHEYAADVGLKITDELSAYLDNEFYNHGQGQPMKNDHIALPDFPSGAMENWGMVNYREAYLLYDEDNTNIVNKIFIASIIAHEMAHKWFGNLVTCFWWSNLWLNESFASFFEYFAADKADPYLELSDLYVIDQVQSALASDAGAGATPMNWTAVSNNPSINAHFSVTSYAKGSSVLRMMEHFVGDTTFRNALRYYLRDNAYEIAYPLDMYTAFRQAVAEDASFATTYPGIDVGAVFDSWVQNPGSPVVNVQVNTETGVITLTQERFQLTGTPNPTTWQIPITWTHGGNPDFTNLKPSFVLTTTTTQVQKEANDDWVILNLAQSGLYRVYYDDDNYARLAQQLREDRSVIHKHSRSQIVNDVLFFIRAGKISMERAFDVLSFLAEETDFYVWAGALTQLDWLRRRLEHIPVVYEEFSEYLMELMEKSIEYVGYDEGANDSASLIQHRMQILNYACNLGHEGCINDSLEKWNQARNNPNYLVPVNARRYVYCTGIRNGDAADYNWLWQRYNTSENTADMVVILRTLACTKDESLLRHYLDQSMYNDRIRIHDKTNAWSFALQGNRENLQVVLSYLYENYNEIRRTYGGQDRLDNAVGALATFLTDFNDISNFQTWLYNNQIAIGSSFSMGQAVITTTLNNIRWGNEAVVDLITAVRSRNGSSAMTASVAVILAAMVAKLLHDISTEMSKMIIILAFALLSLTVADHPIWLSEIEEFESQDNLVSQNAEQVYRLPTNVVPLEYDIYIDLYFAEATDRPFSYDGKENIIIEATEEGVKQIVLHSNVDHIKGVNVFDENGLPLRLDAFNPIVLEPLYHFLKINLVEALELGKKYTLFIEYTSTMNDGPMKRGIWKGWYTDENGNERIYATTHFQPYSARQAFPCWDEPLFKSTFKLHLSRPSAYSATFSNTEIESSEILDNRVRDNFYATPIMSSYLVTFLISETFTVIASDNSFTPAIRIIGRSNTAGLGDHALELAVQMTRFFDEYFQIPYASMHQHLLNDHISSPDWASAGTENWGMVSYRELYMIIDPRETLMSIEHYAATLVSHELAHKWFGNLITCYWWSNTWINEGFASYFGYIAANEMFPEYELHEHFNSRYLQNSLSFDSGVSTVPLNHDVNTPAQVTGHFGTISYSKAAAFLRMVADMLTPETFRKACQYFLTDNAFKATDQYDLYNAFAKAAEEDQSLSEYENFDFAEYYRIWVNEPGYPILHVEVNHENGEISLTQERFFISASATPTNQIYHIPITYSTKSQPTFDNLKPTYMMASKNAVLIKSPGEEWVIFNHQQHGHYRVNYDERTWNLITEALLEDLDAIHYLNRAQIVDDVFALMRSERMTYNFGFQILRFLRYETNYHVWTTAITGYSWLRNRLMHLPDRQATFDAFVLSYMEHVIETVGLDPAQDETPTISILRQELLHFACTMNYERCVQDSRNKFIALRDNNVWVDARIRRNVYVAGIREGGEADFNFLLNRFQTSNFANDQLEMLRGLAATRDPELLTRYLELTLDKSVRSHDKVNSFNYALLGNPENAYTCLQFVKNNIAAIREAYVEDAPPTPVHAVLSNLAAYLDEAGLVEYEEWLRSTQTNTAQFNTAISAISSARANIAWGRANADNILSAARDSATSVVASATLLIAAIIFAMKAM
ncbi:uncharacterized protein LOC121727124 [Aricia agestis]|uniref:uncharacterized protein LOC121727124 n=1 Tax=Aricia agestis TaxID=91739 RepID=UPI001C2075C4|nr:uncharacterized protein LOC121727124 [Aricia agestis]